MPISKITAETMLPISLLGVVAGGIFWLSVLYVNVEHATAEIAGIKEEIHNVNNSRASYRSKLWANQRDIDRRLAKIEGKLDFLIERSQKN
jgi:hypothetical protein